MAGNAGPWIPRARTTTAAYRGYWPHYLSPSENVLGTSHYSDYCENCDILHRLLASWWAVDKRPWSQMYLHIIVFHRYEVCYPLDQSDNYWEPVCSFSSRFVKLFHWGKHPESCPTSYYECSPSDYRLLDAARSPKDWIFRKYVNTGRKIDIVVRD